MRAGGVNRRVRAEVHSEDDLEGSGSHGEHGVPEGSRPAEEVVDRPLRPTEVEEVAGVSLAGVPEAGVSGEIGDELDNTGNSGVVGDMDINQEDTGRFENSVPVQNFEPTSEELVEVFVEFGGINSGDLSQVSLNSRPPLDKGDPNVWLRKEMHENNILGEETPAAMLSVDNIVTTLTHSCAPPNRDKGKHVVGSSSSTKWKKRARHTVMQDQKVQPVVMGSNTRKRGLEVDISQEQVNDNGKQKKCKIVSGVVSNNDPMSVEAVEQPRRPQ
ncbi:hypothetical protein FCV25MIE_12458 [Fagus crenata]